MGVFEMDGEIDNDFTTDEVTHIPSVGSYENGVWVESGGSQKVVSACIQPLSKRELSFLQNGGERVSDFRKLYVTQQIEDLTLMSQFEFFGQRWKVVEFDARPENTYYNIIVARFDE